jgi:hypothetical protein
MIFTPTYDRYLFWSSSAHMYGARGAPAGAPTSSAHELSFIWVFKFLERTYTACKTLTGMDFLVLWLQEKFQNKEIVCKVEKLVT